MKPKIDHDRLRRQARLTAEVEAIQQLLSAAFIRLKALVSDFKFSPGDRIKLADAKALIRAAAMPGGLEDLITGGPDAAVVRRVHERLLKAHGLLAGIDAAKLSPWDRPDLDGVARLLGDCAARVRRL